MEVDTSSQASIRELAREFRRKYRRLNVLINNDSGNRTLPKVLSADGIELTFATNVLGYFLLTQELLKVSKRSAPARIINVASQYASDIDLDDLPFNGGPSRAFEPMPSPKPATAVDLGAGASLKGSGVTANAMTPGLITETKLYRNATPN